MSETETPDLEALALEAWDRANCEVIPDGYDADIAAALRWAAAEIARERARADAAEALLREAGAEMSFLVGRLRDWEVLSDMSKDMQRDWYGHVEPSRARARALADKIRERGE